MRERIIELRKEAESCSAIDSELNFSKITINNIQNMVSGAIEGAKKGLPRKLTPRYRLQIVYNMTRRSKKTLKKVAIAV